MKTKALQIVDSYSVGNFHEMFNSAMLVVCSHQVERIVYRADARSQDCVLSHVITNGYEEELSKVEKKTLFVVRKESTVGLLCRTMVSAFQNARYLFVKRKEPIIYMHNDAFSIYLLNFFNLILKRPIWIVCHGELELLISNPCWYKPSFLYKQLFAFFYKYIPISRHLHFIVLGESILINLKKVLPAGRENLFVAMEHPYFFKKEHVYKKVLPRKLVIGTIGSMNVFKGYYRLLDLAKMLEIPIQAHEITLVVTRFENVKVNRQGLIQCVCKHNGLLPRDEYEQFINGLDYVLFLYASNSYKFIASGAIFDTISFGKPIIALRNDYFVSIFEQCGDIGYLCENIEDMACLILKLLDEPDMTAYDSFLQNMEKAKLLYAPEYVKIDL